jgi:hypothetical protein
LRVLGFTRHDTRNNIAMIFHKEGAEGIHLTPDDNTPVGLELNDTDQEIFIYRFSGVNYHKFLG